MFHGFGRFCRTGERARFWAVVEGGPHFEGTVDRAEGEVEADGDIALCPAFGQFFLDLVGAFETGLAEIRVEHGLFGIETVEGEREKDAVARCEADGREVFAVVDDVGAARGEVFEITEPLVPAASTDGEDRVGKGRDGAGDEKAA